MHGHRGANFHSQDKTYRRKRVASHKNLDEQKKLQERVVSSDLLGHIRANVTYAYDTVSTIRKTQKYRSTSIF